MQTSQKYRAWIVISLNFKSKLVNNPTFSNSINHPDGDGHTKYRNEKSENFRNVNANKSKLEGMISKFKVRIEKLKKELSEKPSKW